MYCSAEMFRAAADLATHDGAHAIGLGTLTGSLDVGKRADVVMVDLRQLHFIPVMHGKNFNVAAHLDLVFSASGRDVTDVWVDGRRLEAGGRVTTVDVDVVRRRAQEAAEELVERRKAVLGLTPSPRNQMADP